jgi:hypothetical protein
MMNNSFQAISTQLNADFPFLNSTATQNLVNVPPVFMEWNPSGSTSLLNAPFCFADNIVPQITSLYVNTSLQVLNPGYTIVTTDIPHGLNVGNQFYIYGSSLTTTNGIHSAAVILSPTSFVYYSTGFVFNTGVLVNSNNLNVTMSMTSPITPAVAVAGQVVITSTWYLPQIVAGMYITITNALTASYNGTFYVLASGGGSYTLQGTSTNFPSGSTSGSTFTFGYTYFHIYFNSILFNLFSSYQSEDYGQTTPTGQNFRIKTPFTGTNVLDVAQSFSPIPPTSGSTTHYRASATILPKA